MEKKIDFLALYQRLFQTLSHGKMQELMDVSYEITGVPILAVDIAYNLLGAVPKNKTGDYYWDYLVEHKRYDMDMTVQLYSDGIMQSVNEKEAPYIVDWGAATEEFPKILGVIKINNIVEGYVVMQCKKGEITEERMKLTVLEVRSLSERPRLDTGPSLSDTPRMTSSTVTST